MSTKKSTDKNKNGIDLNIADYATIEGIKSALESEKNIKDDILDQEYEKNLETLKKDTHTKKRQVYNEAMSTVPIMRENFANYGLSAQGGEVKTQELRFNTALDSALAELDGILLSQSGDMASGLSRAKLENLNTMLKELRSESTRIEALLYQREQDKIQNALEARRVAAQEASNAISKAKLEQQAYEYKNNAMLAAAKLVAEGAGEESGSKYMTYLKQYAGDYLAENGIDLSSVNTVTTVQSNGATSGSTMVGKSDEIREHLFVLRHVSMSDDTKYKYYIDNGLDKYMTFEQAING